MPNPRPKTNMKVGDAVKVRLERLRELKDATQWSARELGEAIFVVRSKHLGRVDIETVDKEIAATVMHVDPMCLEVVQLPHPIRRTKKERRKRTRRSKMNVDMAR